jgi:hypothetical protein
MTYTLESASITALDTIPVLKPDAGQGAPTEDKELNDYVAFTTGQLGSTSTTANILRLPTTAKVNRLRIDTDGSLDSNGSPTLAFNVGLAYSDAPLSGVLDGTQPSLAGTSISATSFANSQTVSVKARAVDISPSVINKQKPLWQGVAGLASDPGGFFDIYVTVEAAAATAVAGNFGLEVEYSY